MRKERGEGGEREGGREGRGREGRGREGGRGEGGREGRGREGGEREGGRGEGRAREEGGEREVTMGTGIYSESSNILQEVCQSRPAPAECVREDRSREAEQSLGELTANGKTGGKGCGNGR